MIQGTIQLEDVRIQFHVNYEDNTVSYVVSEDLGNKLRTEKLIVPQAKFFKALAIAVHNDGMPDADVDYPDAESIMGEIRWIP